MRTLSIVFITAFVAFFLTNTWARGDRDAQYADLLWAKCPQLILEPQNPERAWIQFLDGAMVPIRPRRTPAGVSPSN